MYGIPDGSLLEHKRPYIAHHRLFILVGFSEQSPASWREHEKRKKKKKKKVLIEREKRDLQKIW